MLCVAHDGDGGRCRFLCSIILTAEGLSLILPLWLIGDTSIESDVIGRAHTLQGGAHKLPAFCHDISHAGSSHRQATNLLKKELGRLETDLLPTALQSVPGSSHAIALGVARLAGRPCQGSRISAI